MNRSTIPMLTLTAAVGTWLFDTPAVRADPVADMCYLFCSSTQDQDDAVAAVCSSFCSSSDSSSDSISLPMNPQAKATSTPEGESPTATTNAGSATSVTP